MSLSLHYLAHLKYIKDVIYDTIKMTWASLILTKYKK